MDAAMVPEAWDWNRSTGQSYFEIGVDASLQYCLEIGEPDTAILPWDCNRWKLQHCLVAWGRRWTLQYCLRMQQMQAAILPWGCCDDVSRVQQVDAAMMPWDCNRGSCNVAWGCNRWKSQYCLEIGVTGHCNIALRLQQMEVAILPWDRSRWTLHRCFGAAVDGSYNDASE